MAERVFPKGVMAFKPLPQAPTWVKASISITLNDLVEFCKGDGAQYLTEYNGKKQIKLQITENKADGKFSITVDTYKKGDSTPTKGASDAAEHAGASNSTDDSQDLPF